MMSDEDKDGPFMSRPLCVFRGHASDVLDVSWSKVRRFHLLFAFKCVKIMSETRYEISDDGVYFKSLKNSHR